MPQIVDLTSAALKDLRGLNEGVQSALRTKLALEETQRRKDALDLARVKYGSEQAQAQAGQQAVSEGFGFLGSRGPEDDLRETMAIGYDLAARMPPRDRGQFLDELGAMVKTQVVESKRAEVMSKLDRLAATVGDSEEMGARVQEMRDMLAEAEDPDQVERVVDDLASLLVSTDREQMTLQQGASWAQSTGFDPTNPMASSPGEMETFAKWRRGLYSWDMKGLTRFQMDMLDARREALRARSDVLYEPEADMDERYRTATGLGLVEPDEDPFGLRGRNLAVFNEALGGRPEGGTTEPATSATSGTPPGAAPGRPGPAEAGAPSRSRDGEPKAFSKVPRADQRNLLDVLERTMPLDPTRSQLEAIFATYNVDPDSLPPEVVQRLMRLKTERGRATEAARGVVEQAPSFDMPNLLPGQ